MEVNNRDIDTRPSFNKQKSQFLGMTDLFTVRNKEWIYVNKKTNSKYINMQEQAEIHFRKSIIDLDNKFSNTNVEYYLENAKSILYHFPSMYMPTLAAAYLIFHNLVSQDINKLDYDTFQELTQNYATIIINKSKEISSPDLIEKHQMDMFRYLHAILLNN